jgi:hypothetical protein
VKEQKKWYGVQSSKLDNKTCRIMLKNPILETIITTRIIILSCWSASPYGSNDDNLNIAIHILVPHINIYEPQLPFQETKVL